MVESYHEPLICRDVCSREDTLWTCFKFLDAYLKGEEASVTRVINLLARTTEKRYICWCS